VAPSTNTNNRYLKVTPQGDRVRLAYTVFMGEVPGAVARQRMDTNKNGTLEQAEADAYGKQIAEALQGALRVSVDGTAYPVTWAQTYVGLGTPTTSAGAFSIDMIAWFCVPDPSKRAHKIELFDRFHLAEPGELELRIDESPGVTVTESKAGEVRKTKPQLQFKWTNTAQPLAKTPLHLAFRVADDVTFTADAICPAKGAAATKGSGTEKKSNTTAIITMIVGALFLIGLGVWAVRKGAI
jgi:hypothetical protein